MRISSLALVAALGLATPAWAHAFLKTATPAVGSTVEKAPGEVVITFTEGVEPTFSSIAVQGPGGEAEATGQPHLDGADTRLAVAVKPLQPGSYTVVWHATATDTHKTEGQFSFTVAP